VRVLVTDADERSALAACRGLAAAGYAVSTAATRRIVVGHWSRFSSRRFTLPDPRSDAAAYAEALAELLRRERHDVVLAGSEASMLAISVHREELGALTGLPEHESVLRAVDKVLLQREAAVSGLPPPESAVCGDAAEAVVAAGSFGLPVVVKPSSSFVGHHAGFRKGMVQVCASAEAVTAATASLGAPVTVQRYVHEPQIVSCAGVRLDSGIAGFTVARYARTWPPHVGSASMAKTIEPPGGLERSVDDLLARIGWAGIFELELFDLGEGQLAAIDLNPRVFGWLALAIAAGANLPAIWCDHVLGRPVRAQTARAGVPFRWEDGELRHVLRALHTLDLGAAVRLMRPVRRVAHPYFQVSDPGPLLARAVAAARKP
jgi:predicted ATP-grasp superfamily ATP-dependent carboligase